MALPKPIGGKRSRPVGGKVISFSLLVDKAEVACAMMILQERPQGLYSFWLITTLPISVADVLRYLVWWLGGIVCLAVPVPSHHISEVGAGAHVLYNLVDNISVVILVSLIVSFIV